MAFKTSSGQLVINKLYERYYCNNALGLLKLYICLSMKSRHSGLITSSPPHSIIHVTKVRNMFLTICIILADDIEMNPVPPILQNIRLATNSVRSIYNKSANITGFVISKKLDILVLTDIWLSPHDICPPNYSCYYHSRQSESRGGVGFQVFNIFKVKSHSLEIYYSFEAVCIEILELFI